MTTIPLYLEVRTPVAVAEPRGSLAVAQLTDRLMRLAGLINGAARMVAHASRRSHGSWRE